MNREELIRMAREVKGAARTSATDGSLWLLSESHLERFAALVAAAEREACAKVCDEREYANMYGFKECAAAIRARGQE
jgi:hypothetical protein